MSPTTTRHHAGKRAVNSLIAGEGSKIVVTTPQNSHMPFPGAAGAARAPARSFSSSACSSRRPGNLRMTAPEKSWPDVPEMLCATWQLCSRRRGSDCIAGPNTSKRTSPHAATATEPRHHGERSRSVRATQPSGGDSMTSPCECTGHRPVGLASRSATRNRSAATVVTA